jgi:hypothetical protein
VDYVTAVCVVHRPADETLAWAIAGHPPPLRLDDGEPLDDWGAGQPLGLEAELAEERLQTLVASHGRESAPALVEHLRVALAAYAPAGGDDVCLLAARNRTRVGSEADR